jgi:hypothetical protein
MADIDLGTPEVVRAIENYMPSAFVEVNKMCKVFAAAEGIM